MSLETKIFLVRHGETEWNKENRLQGKMAFRGISNSLHKHQHLEHLKFALKNLLHLLAKLIF